MNEGVTNGELPDGWVNAPLLMVSTLIRGVTYSRGDARSDSFSESIPVLRANNLQDRGFLLDDLVYVPKSLVSGQQRVSKGDVVVATSSGSISVVGKAVQASKDMNVGFGAFCGLLRPSPELHAPYFGFFFSSDSYRKSVSSMARGVNINNLKRDHFETINLPLAPLAEQKRIADKLELVLGRVDACRARLDRVPVLLKRFRQSVLAAATSGKLTEEWRAENGASDEWQRTELVKLVAEPLRNGKSVRDGSGTPVLRLTALRGGKFDWRESKQGDWTGLDASRFFVRDGDFLVIRGNGSKDLVGRGCLAVNPPDEIAFPDTLIRVRPNEAVLRPTYLALVWDSVEVREQIELSAKTTTGLWKVAQGDLESVTLPLPPIPEQQEIVRRVEALFSFADRIEARLAVAQKTVERLTPAVLAKAFRGELVPQDPADEPASALLARLREALAANPPKPKRGRRRTGKSS